MCIEIGLTHLRISILVRVIKVSDFLCEILSGHIGISSISRDGHSSVLMSTMGTVTEQGQDDVRIRIVISSFTSLSCHLVCTRDRAKSIDGYSEKNGKCLTRRVRVFPVRGRVPGREDPSGQGRLERGIPMVSYLKQKGRFFMIIQLFSAQ